jgi:hypothetical protein
MDRENWRPDLDYYGVPKRDPGWIYAVKSENRVRIGKTTDRERRFRAAQTWSPDPLDFIGVKPFWNITKLEYSLHTCLAEFWHRGDWYRFDDAYWFDFFASRFREFSDKNRDANSVDFIYWMAGDGYTEVIEAQ